MDYRDNKSQDENPDFLSELKGPSGFNIPDNYFVEMQQAVLDQVLDTSETVSESSSWFDNLLSSFQYFLRPQYALLGIAAIVLLGLTIGIQTNTTLEQPESALDGLSQADLEFYLESGMEEMNNQDFYAVLTSNDGHTIAPLTTVTIPSEIANQYIEELDESEFIYFQTAQEE